MFLLPENLRLLVALFLVQSLEKECRKESREDSKLTVVIFPSFLW